MKSDGDQVHLLRQLLERNQHTLEDKISELSLLRVVNEALASEADAPEQMRRVVSYVADLIEAQGGDVLLKHGDRLESIIDSEMRPRASAQVIEWVLEHQEPQLVPDIRTDPRFEEGDEEASARSLLAFPLVFRGEVLGVLVVWHSAPEAFGKSTERVLHLLTGQLAVAAKNMDLIQTLRAEHNYRDNLINSSADAIITTDTRGTVILANRPAEEVWGIDPNELTGRGVGEGLEGGDEVSSVVVDVLRHGRPLRGRRIRLSRRPKLPAEIGSGADSVTLDVEISCSPIRTDEGRIIGTVTILSHIEDRLRLEQQLVASESMASKGRMAAEIGHELANYMNGIMGHASLVPYMLEEGDNAGALESVALICRQVEGTARFAHSLMDFSRLETMLEPAPINDLIWETIRFVQPQNSFDDVSFAVRLDPADPVVSMDSAQIQQILINLFKNAAEATRGRKCTIGVVTTVDPDNRIRLVVQDNGPGLPEEVREVLFERPITTKKDGHGFGLPICKRIAENHSGDLECSTGIGEGTTFTLTLGHPIHARHAAGREAKAVPGDGGALRLA